MNKEEIIMKRQNKLITMKYIDPSEINSLPSNEVILVSRITLNNARAYSSLVSRENNDSYVALIEACQTLYAQDAKRNRPSFGVEMSVVEVKKIFGDQLSNLPKHSFVVSPKLQPT